MGNPEYRTMRSWGRGGDPETDFGMIERCVTGWDIACHTLGFYVNSGVGHWMSWGGQPGEVSNRK